MFLLSASVIILKSLYSSISFLSALFANFSCNVLWLVFERYFFIFISYEGFFLIWKDLFSKIFKFFYIWWRCYPVIQNLFGKSYLFSKNYFWAWKLSVYYFIFIIFVIFSNWLSCVSLNYFSKFNSYSSYFSLPVSESILKWTEFYL